LIKIGKVEWHVGANREERSKVSDRPYRRLRVWPNRPQAGSDRSLLQARRTDRDEFSSKRQGTADIRCLRQEFCCTCLIRIAKRLRETQRHRYAGRFDDLTFSLNVVNPLLSRRACMCYFLLQPQPHPQLKLSFSKARLLFAFRRQARAKREPPSLAVRTEVQTAS
jgi:hypothetical protein